MQLGTGLGLTLWRKRMMAQDAPLLVDGYPLLVDDFQIIFT